MRHDASSARAERLRGDFWLSTSGDDLGPRARLKGTETVDVAILGGGFSGLWTAYFLLRNDPSLSVAVVERDFCGFGASGRNGGWCSPRFPVDAGALSKRFGPEIARATMIEQMAMVEHIGQICEEEGIDAHYHASGLLSVARSEAQLASLHETQRAYAALGLSEGTEMLDAEAARARVHATRITGALRSRAGATLHPGRLVRGLARTVERLGGAIYEDSAVLRIVPGADAALETAHGVVRARRAIVTAGEAYLTQFPQFRRTLLPMSSMIVLTAPLTPAQWEAVGWEDGASLSSQVRTKNYLTRTRDGRILFGSRGARYLYGSRMPEAALREDEATFAWMRACVRDWWPALEDVEFTHSWGGYLGVPRDWLPTVHFDADARLAQLHGYTGRGVSTSAMCAQLLAGLIGGWRTGLEHLPFHRARARLWEPEPLRWMGVRYIQDAFARIDEADEGRRTPPIDARLAEALGEP